MKFAEKILMFATILLLVSCGLKGAKEERLERKVKKVEREKDPLIFDKVKKVEREKYPLIFDGEILDGDMFVGYIEEGDRIRMKVSGKVVSDSFSPIYTKTFDSVSWHSECTSPYEGYRRAECFFKIEDYCKLKYRDYLGKKEEAMSFPGELAKGKLFYRIGKKKFPPGEILEYSENEAIVEFEVNSEMAEAGNEIFLVTASEESQGTIKTGFVGYGNCPGRQERSFRHYGPTKSKKVKSLLYRIYQVSVGIKKKKGAI